MLKSKVLMGFGLAALTAATFAPVPASAVLVQRTVLVEETGWSS